MRVKDCWAGCLSPAFCEGIPQDAFPVHLTVFCPSHFPHQSICGDCAQGQAAHSASLLVKGEKGDQGVPGVPGFNDCARVGTGQRQTGTGGLPGVGGLPGAGPAITIW